MQLKEKGMPILLVSNNPPPATSKNYSTKRSVRYGMMKCCVIDILACRGMLNEGNELIHHLRCRHCGAISKAGHTITDRPATQRNCEQRIGVGNNSGRTPSSEFLRFKLLFYHAP